MSDATLSTLAAEQHAFGAASELPHASAGLTGSDNALFPSGCVCQSPPTPLPEVLGCASSPQSLHAPSKTPLPVSADTAGAATTAAAAPHQQQQQQQRAPSLLDIKALCSLVPQLRDVRLQIGRLASEAMDDYTSPLAHDALASQLQAFRSDLVRQAERLIRKCCQRLKVPFEALTDGVAKEAEEVPAGARSAAASAECAASPRAAEDDTFAGEDESAAVALTAEETAQLRGYGKVCSTLLEWVMAPWELALGEACDASLDASPDATFRMLWELLLPVGHLWWGASDNKGRSPDSMRCVLVRHILSTMSGHVAQRAEDGVEAACTLLAVVRQPLSSSDWDLEQDKGAELVICLQRAHLPGMYRGVEALLSHDQGVTYEDQTGGATCFHVGRLVRVLKETQLVPGAVTLNGLRRTLAVPRAYFWEAHETDTAMAAELNDLLMTADSQLEQLAGPAGVEGRGHSRAEQEWSSGPQTNVGMREARGREIAKAAVESLVAENRKMTPAAANAMLKAIDDYVWEAGKPRQRISPGNDEGSLGPLCHVCKRGAVCAHYPRECRPCAAAAVAWLLDALSAQSSTHWSVGQMRTCRSSRPTPPLRCCTRCWCVRRPTRASTSAAGTSTGPSAWRWSCRPGC